MAWTRKRDVEKPSLVVDGSSRSVRTWNEFVLARGNATPETLRDYESILAKLAIDHADLELADFEPPIGTTRLREFIGGRWGDNRSPFFVLRLDED